MKKITAIFIASLLIGCSGKAPILGVVDGALSECPSSPNCVCSQSKSEDHLVSPFSIAGSQIKAKECVAGVLGAIDSAETITVEDDYIRAEFTSTLFRYVDDVEFYFPNTADNTTIIHVRSASRLGYSDFGVNRDRVETLRTKINQSKECN